MTRTPGSPLTTTAQQLVDEANSRITTLTRDEVLPLLDDPGTLLVDIRDVRELEREGTIPGAKHAPRGMLEFWVDPDSPYFKPVFGEPKRFILYCQSAWRSALATAALQDMGMDNVAHVEGGFTEWKKQGAPIESYEAHRARRAS